MHTYALFTYAYILHAHARSRAHTHTCIHTHTYRLNRQLEEWQWLEAHEYNNDPGFVQGDSEDED